MIRRQLPYTLACGATFIVLPSVAANGTAGAQVVTALENTDAVTFAVTLSGILLLTLGARLFARAVAQKVARWRIHRILAMQASDVLGDFILPGAYGGLTHIDHAVLTKRGIFCIQTSFYTGTVSGGAGEPQWTNVKGASKRSFLNPRIQSEGRARALRKLVPGVPLTNLVVFRNSVEFQTPMENNVMHIRELENYVAEYDFELCNARDLHEAWATIKSAVLTDEASRKDFHAQLSFS